MSRVTAGCVDLCASCSSAVKTFANLQVVGDEKYLAPTWMPPGGCTCQGMKVDRSCPRCFPKATLCQPCGERRISPVTQPNPTTTETGTTTGAADE